MQVFADLDTTPIDRRETVVKPAPCLHPEHRHPRPERARPAVPWVPKHRLTTDAQTEIQPLEQPGGPRPATHREALRVIDAAIGLDPYAGMICEPTPDRLVHLHTGSVTLRHFEVLDKEGNVYTANLREATQTVTYILKGGGPEVFEPHFTFQGFRYVAVSGLPGEPSPEQLTGVVIHSDIPPAGTFTSSEPLLNQLQKNIWWGQKGNFLDVPTDCPQRDERLGWTGDAQAFAPTACFNADVSGFFVKWLKDLAADQQSSGAVPYVIPNVLSHG